MNSYLLDLSRIPGMWREHLYPFLDEESAINLSKVNKLFSKQLSFIRENFQKVYGTLGRTEDLISVRRELEDPMYSSQRLQRETNDSSDALGWLFNDVTEIMRDLLSIRIRAYLQEQDLHYTNLLIQPPIRANSPLQDLKDRQQRLRYYERSRWELTDISNRDTAFEPFGPFGKFYNRSVVIGQSTGRDGVIREISARLVSKIRRCDDSCRDGIFIYLRTGEGRGQSQELELNKCVRKRAAPHELQSVPIFSSEYDTRNESAQFSEPFLRVEGVFPFKVAPDPLIVELVMMIFAREPENRFEICTSWPDQWIAGGFGVQAFPGANYTRVVEGQLQEDGDTDFYIRKTEVPHRVSDVVETRFVTNDASNVERAVTIQGETWEQKLNHGRIVLWGNGPVLPVSDYSRYF